MSKYDIECEVAMKSLMALRELPGNFIAYDTQLLMLDRHMAKVRAAAPAVHSHEHVEVQSFLDSPDIRERLIAARARIRQITSRRGRDKKAVLKANLQLLSFRRKAGRPKRLGVGYGQVHTPVAGGAPDSNRRRH
jgi:hypothetical protein